MLASVRARVTAIALVAMLVTLSVGSIALLTVLRQSLVDEIDQTITNRAFDVAIEIDIRNELDNASFPSDPETFVGIIEFVGTEPVLEIHNDDQPSATELLAYLDDGTEPVDASVPSITLTEGADNLRLVFAGVADGDELVAVARTLDGVDRTVDQVRNIALAAVPLLALLVSGLVYALTGRALRPVERMRSEVDSITAGDLSRRVEAGTRPDEVSRLATTMNSMLERLEGAQARQRRFSSDAAHELRSPLASIRAQLDVDLAHPDIADWDRSARHIDSEVERMQRMVDDLLVLARSEQNADMSGLRLIDLDDLVLTEVAAVRATSPTAITTSNVSAASVRGNADHLRRAINNLLTNAVRHATSTVVITLSERDGRAILVVDDDGAGIPNADRERVFERFVRLDEARSRDSGGSGLGLALAREVAVAHQGTLHAEANEHGGAGSFSISLSVDPT